MVLTRSQAAKVKATASPEPAAAKFTKKHQRAGEEPAGGGAAPPPQPLADKAAAGGLRVDVGAAMGQKSSLLRKGGPASHPIASLPSSPAPLSAGSPSPEFTIPAAQPQQAQREAAPAGPAPQQQDPQQQQQQGAAEEAAVQVEARPQQPAAAAQQLAQPPAPQPRPEKLLKPLPDKPVACDKLPDGPEPVQVEVEYVAREELAPADDPAAALAAALPGLAAADWLENVRALNLLRQLAVHSPDTCSSQLDALVPLVLKSVRSLRSSLCKTAIMAVADLYLSYGDALLPHTDVGGQAKPLTSLLAQVLLKASSNDKKFVIEEAQRALQVMVDSLSPAQALALLLPYADQHKNPKVRGTAGGVVAAAAARLDAAGMAAVGLPRLLQAAGKLVTDNTPEAREGAKRLIGLLKAAFADPGVEQQLGFEPPPPPPAEGEEPSAPPTRWQAYCQATLSPSAALAVLKASAD